MPAYIQSPFKPMPQLLVAGSPSYVWGSFNDRTGPTLIQVTQSKTNGTTTATIQFKIVSGNVPVNGSLLTLVGSSVSANFNVTNVAIANVTQVDTPDDGTYTATYTIASTATPTTFTADAAQGSIPQPEVAETVSTTGASFPVAIAAAGANANGRSLSVTVKLPNSGTLSGVTAVLQGANVDLDSEYNTVGTIGTGLAANSVTDWQSGQGVPTAPSNSLAVGNVNFPNFRFYRINFTALTGSGPVIAKIMQ